MLTIRFALVTVSFLLLEVCTLQRVDGFSAASPGLLFNSRFRSRKFTVLSAKSKRGSGGGSSNSASVGIKGFGGTTAVPKGNGEEVELDKSSKARAFYEYLEKNGASDNLKRVALGFFPLPNGGKLRGVVAVKSLKKGDVIIRIPYPMAVNLGVEGEDPTMPGLTLLRDYCATLGLSGQGREVIKGRQPYYEMLPPFQSEDCYGSTDFFSDQALDALQSPSIVRETLRRRDRVNARFEELINISDETSSLWTDGSPLQEEHLRWAVWLITSRVLTVQGDEAEGRAYRLLIPLLDMCNHDRSSPHILTGRAVANGELKVVAGSNIAVGEQINICYGGGVAGNDRFIQDYGFLDDNSIAYDVVAQQLLGKRRLVEGSNAGRLMQTSDRSETISCLASTTMDEDEALLSNDSDFAIRSAIQYRLGVKRALAKQNNV